MHCRRKAYVCRGKAVLFGGDVQTAGRERWEKPAPRERYVLTGKSKKDRRDRC